VSLILIGWVGSLYHIACCTRLFRIMVTFRRQGSSSGTRPKCSVQKLFVGLVVVIGALLLFALQLGTSLLEAHHSLATNNNKSVTADGSSGVNKGPIQVAYAISLIKCSDFQSSTSGLIDAATILRHSVHQQSLRNPNSGSKYDYKMYAIVHKNAESCSHMLEDLGYHIIVKDSPVKISEIRGDYLRNNVHKEWCCGADEFIKLYAYKIHSHPIVVHTDIGEYKTMKIVDVSFIMYENRRCPHCSDLPTNYYIINADFMFVKPMDDLYDAMLLPHDSTEGKAARDKIELEYPDKRQSMPENIQAYLTRDYHQVIPGRKAAFQAGFIVLKPNQKVFDEYLEIIREGNFVEGFSRENGWGGKGYGGVVGAMAMQGLPAYYYDEVAKNTSVELNGCRYNHMGANIFYEK